MKDKSESISGSTGMIPIMFGYHHDFGGLYGEPKIGLMIVKSKINMDDMGFGLSGFYGYCSTTNVSFGLCGGYMFGTWVRGGGFRMCNILSFYGMRFGQN